MTFMALSPTVSVLQLKYPAFILTYNPHHQPFHSFLHIISLVVDNVSDRYYHAARALRDLSFGKRANALYHKL